MNYLDIIICIPLLWALLKGYRTGFVLAIATLASLVLGIYLAYEFSYIISDILQEYLEIKNEALPLVSFIATFGGVIICVHFLANVLEKALNMAALGLVNKLAGALFSFIKVGLIISVILYAGSLLEKPLNIIPQEIKEESLVFEPIKKVPPTLLPLLKNFQLPDSLPYFEKDTIPELP